MVLPFELVVGFQLLGVSLVGPGQWLALLEIVCLDSPFSMWVVVVELILWVHQKNLQGAQFMLPLLVCLGILQIHLCGTLD